MNNYTGVMQMEMSCHCGNLQLKVAYPPESLNSCNCSICRRYGSLWAYYAPDQVEIAAGSQAAVPYRWGEGYLDFMHCPVCGCVTHYTSTDKVEEPKTGVNFRMASPADIQGIRIRHFDGADTWKFLD